MKKNKKQNKNTPVEIRKPGLSTVEYVEKKDFDFLSHLYLEGKVFLFLFSFFSSPPFQEFFSSGASFWKNNSFWIGIIFLALFAWGEIRAWLLHKKTQKKIISQKIQP